MKSKHSKKEITSQSLTDKRWFKLACLLIFFGSLFYITIIKDQIDPKELTQLNITVTKSFSGRTKSHVKMFFRTVEYKNKFGIGTGGIFANHTNVKNAITTNSKISIRIKRNEIKYLNDPKSTIMIYYLHSEKYGEVFNEEAFNRNEEKSGNRFSIFVIILFIICIWKYIF